MSQVIIYPNDENGICVVCPAPGISIDEVAKKDVPAGKPYKIINKTDIPQDRTFRNAWEWQD